MGLHRKLDASCKSAIENIAYSSLAENKSTHTVEILNHAIHNKNADTWAHINTKTHANTCLGIDS